MTAHSVVGTVNSHTMVRMPGHAHADRAPFVLLLVETEDGKRCLGHFAGNAAPPIGARVVGCERVQGTLVFEVVQEKS
jgi:uncharacterized OB-fold protein